MLSLQLKRSPLLVYKKAGLKKVWIRYNIRDSARRLHFICTARISPSYFRSRCLPQLKGLPPGTAVERCCVPATRLGLETSR